MIYICAELYVIGGRGEGSKILTRLSGCFFGAWSAPFGVESSGALGYNIHVLLLAASGDLSTHGHEDQALLGGCMLLRLHHQWLAFRAR